VDAFPNYEARRAIRLRDTERFGPEGEPFACRSNLKRSCYAYIRFCSPLPFKPSASTGCSRCSTKLGGVEGSVPSYPPYNIERNRRKNGLSVSQSQSPDSTDADLSIEAKENMLTIRGEKTGQRRGKRPATFSTRGIAERPF